ncbi:hypothetical protein GQ42DRAFT_18662 [Ramicandelaber brevisporus]|nr:hypothetical protein GQ42DRAFT_18662 [Ramicandelaber brevisporus]
MYPKKSFKWERRKINCSQSSVCPTLSRLNCFAGGVPFNVPSSSSSSSSLSLLNSSSSSFSSNSTVS